MAVVSCACPDVAFNCQAGAEQKTRWIPCRGLLRMADIFGFVHVSAKQECSLWDLSELLFLYFFFRDKVLLYHPGWRAMV